MGYIYKITNDVNGKVYIGKTVKTIEERFKEHLRNSRKQYADIYNSHLSRAIRYYGKEHFSVSLVGEYPNDELNDREIQWINTYNSFDDSVGYNMTLGGEGVTKIDHDEIFSLWDDGHCTTEISELIGCGRRWVYKVLSSSGTYSSEENASRTKEYLGPMVGSEVDQYTLDGEYVQTFSSMTDAGTTVEGASRKVIKRCCEGTGNTSGGYQWRYKGDPPPGTITSYDSRKRQVDCYTKEEEYICTYDSLVDAANDTGGDPRYIADCCKGKRKTAAKLKWKYHDMRELDSTVRDKSKKPVIQYDKEMNIIQMYDSIAQAAKNTPAPEAGIRKCCNGEFKTSGGYIWRYAS